MRGIREQQDKLSRFAIAVRRWLLLLAFASMLSGCATREPRAADARPSEPQPHANIASSPGASAEAGADEAGNTTTATDAPADPLAASGFEPPVSQVNAGRASETPADHPAAPAPQPGNASKPAVESTDRSGAPAEPAHAFETDVLGETRPGTSVPIGARGVDDQPLDPLHLCDQLAPSDEQTIEQTRRRVEEMVCTASMWFDGLFGDRYYFSESREVNGVIELSENYSQFYGNKVRLRFNAQVPLPNLNRHLSAFIGRDNNDDFIQDRFDNSTLRNNFPRVDDHEKVFAGLGYSLPGSDRFDTNLRAGVHGLAHPEAFVQGRVRYNVYADSNDLINVRATPFFTTLDRFGLTVGADYSHVLSKTLLFRFANVATRSQITQGLDWRSTLTVYQALLQIQSGLAYELFIRGESQDDVPLHEYGFQTTFRHPMFGAKLYGEWVLGYSFPRQDRDQRREGSYLTGVSVQMPFGKQK